MQRLEEKQRLAKEKQRFVASMDCAIAVNAPPPVRRVTAVLLDAPTRGGFVYIDVSRHLIFQTHLNSNACHMDQDSVCLTQGTMTDSRLPKPALASVSIALQGLVAGAAAPQEGLFSSWVDARADAWQLSGLAARSGSDAFGTAARLQAMTGEVCCCVSLYVIVRARIP